MLAMRSLAVILACASTSALRKRKAGRSEKQPVDGWGVPPDERNPTEIHCAELHMQMDEGIASGTWPVREPAVRGAAVPCSGGMAGSWTCNGIDLLSFTPLSNFTQIEANDIWGWTDPETGKEYAIMGVRDGTVFVDVTIPTEPEYLVLIKTHTTASIWRDIKVYANRAYIVSEARGHGLQVYDLTRLRGVSSLAEHLPDAHFDYFGNSHNIVINEETARAYAVGTTRCSGGLVMLDISALTPVFLNCFSADGYTHDAECVIYRGPDAAYRGKEICFNYNEDTLTIVDVTDAAAPTQISRLGYESSVYTHQGWLDEDQAFAYMNDELDEGDMANPERWTRTYIINVTSLENPSMYSIYTHSTLSTDHNEYILGDYVYQANYAAGLRILKIKPDHNLEEVGYFVTPTAWSVYPYFASGNLIVSSTPAGLFVLRPNGEYSSTPKPPPTPAPTPVPTPAPVPVMAQLLYPNAECGAQGKNLGVLTTADDCAFAAQYQCETFMHARLAPGWGCRCCEEAAGGIPHQYWSVFSVVPAPPPGP